MRTSGQNADGLNITELTLVFFLLVLRRVGQERDTSLMIIQVFSMVTKDLVKMIMWYVDICPNHFKQIRFDAVLYSI